MREWIHDAGTFLSHIADSYVWGWGPSFLGGVPLMVILLLGTGIVLTCCTLGVQVRWLGRAIRLTLTGAGGKRIRSQAEGDITPFQALMTALAATVGNGNIAGVATAVASGGPGAAFWMVITAVFGMATKYSECLLGVKYRVKMPDGTMNGGPMDYCKHGIGGPVGRGLAVTFAAFGTICTLIGTGNPFQTNSMALALRTQAGVPQWVTGAVVTLLVGLVIIGGIRRIGNVAGKFVPFMIFFYFGGCLLIILARITDVPEAIATIVRSAWSPRAAFGGALGFGIQQAIRFGVARGILSNESGLGTAGIAQAAGKSDSPAESGLIGMMGTFIDTIIVCTLTATVLTVTGVYRAGPAFGGTLNSSAMTAEAFNTVIPFGGYIVAVASLLFGISTLFGWCYYGEQCVRYLFGLRVTTLYRVLFIVIMFLGALPDGENFDITAVVAIGDIGNGMMAIPNLIGLLFLARVVARETRDYAVGRGGLPGG
jgi:AGCS family alanine or glycine:cation symporter